MDDVLIYLASTVGGEPRVGMQPIWIVPYESIRKRPDGGYDAELLGANEAARQGFPGALVIWLAMRFAVKHAEIDEVFRAGMEVFGPDHELIHERAGPVRAFGGCLESPTTFSW